MTGITMLGSTSFAALVWGSIALVVIVFVYVAVTYTRELRRSIGE